MKIDTEGTIDLPHAATIGRHIAVLGTTGSGKTNTGYVWAEEEVRGGGRLTIVDPEGDYHHLRDSFDVLIIGRARRGNPIDVPVEPEDGARVAELLAHRGVNVIADLSGWPIAGKNAFVLSYLGSLWALYQDEDLPPMRLIVDEVQLFAPQGPRTEAKELIQDIASRGRKRGLALLVASQRPQRVDKSVLDETSIRFLHRVARGNTLKAITEFLPGDLPNAVNIVPGLERGAAIYMFDDKAQVIHVRQSDTFRPGQVTPVEAVQLRLEAALIDELKALIAVAPVEVSGTPGTLASVGSDHTLVERITRENADLGRRLQALSAEHEKSCRELEQLRVENEALKADAERRGNPIWNQLLAAGAVVGVGPVKPGAEGPVSSLAPVEAAPDLRTPLATTRAINAQQRDFDRLLRDVRGLKHAFHLAILRFLIEHEDTPYKYNVKELARYVGVQVDTLINRPPLRLCKEMRLLSRMAARQNFVYWSCASSTLKARFPDLPTDKLIQDILKAC